MRQEAGRWSIAGLQRELAAVEGVLAVGDAPVRRSALCWMAAVVGTLPPGPAQEAAEDRLAARIAEAGLRGQPLRDVLLCRRQGLLGPPLPPAPTLRR